MESLTTIQIVEIAESYGAQEADRDIARRVHKVETDCAAYDAYQALRAGINSIYDAEEDRMFAASFSIGYEAAFVEREQLVYKAQIIGTHAVRACYHCQVRKAADLRTQDGKDYLNAAIIICMDCIERLGERVA